MDTERIWNLWAKSKSGEASSEELAELTSLLNNLENNAGNEVFEKIWNAPLNSLPEMKPADSLWQKIEQNIREPKPSVLPGHKKVFRWLAAASVILITGAGIFFLVKQAGSEEKNLVQSVATTHSAKKHVVLPDGSQVWLNINSELVYDNKNFGKALREVKLVGEAFFDVAKDASHPFIVHAGAINITVKGTAFNVKAYPDQKKVEAALIHGLIEITTRQDPERNIMLKPNEKIAVPVEREGAKPLKESEQPLFTISKLHVDEENILPETVWMNSSLSFDNESLEALVPKLESWFSVIIHINDDMLKTKRFSGMIKTETLEQTLEALKLSYPFSYTIKKGEVWISKE